MRDRSPRATLAAMQFTTPRQRAILDAAIDGSVIRGTLTAPSGERREFHGWLELHTALETMLHASCDRDQPASGRSMLSLDEHSEGPLSRRDDA